MLCVVLESSSTLLAHTLSHSNDLTWFHATQDHTRCQERHHAARRCADGVRALPRREAVGSDGGALYDQWQRRPVIARDDGSGAGEAAATCRRCTCRRCCRRGLEAATASAASGHATDQC